MPKTCSTRRWVLCEKFVIFPLIIDEFGTITILLSTGSMIVENRFISFTVPVVPAASMTSPTLNGRKMIIKTAAPMFESESLVPDQ